MSFPITRMRRLRKSAGIRKMLQTNHVLPENLIYPVFVTMGKNKKNPIPSMPGIYQFSLDLVREEIEKVVKAGIQAVILFGIPASKDAQGTGAYSSEGIIQQAVYVIKQEFPELVVITDVCLCEYTDHGHCGVVKDGIILNDPTLELLAQTALSHVQAGADIVAPSDMMDGRVGAIRQALDKAGFSETAIMAYSAKYASAFYGPFRDAAGSAPQFGDRKTYQMDTKASWQQALLETALDVEEGADMVMVKPALAYLDIISRVKEEFLCPVVSYNVSGEYAMIKAAAEKGWLDEKQTVLEMMTGLKRAGSDLIITYHALDVAKWLKEENF